MKYIIAIEPGSSKIRGALGTVDDNGTLTVKAVEEEPLKDSVCHGRVRNVANVAAVTRNILARLEAHEPSMRINGVYVSLGGRSTRADKQRFEDRLPSENEITNAHLENLMRTALNTVYNDRDIVAIVPQAFYVDNIATTNPVGTYGREIAADFNMVSTRQQLKRNLSHAFDKTLHMGVRGYVVRQLAEADLVLSSDEKHLGVMLVDFGAETTTVSIYKDGVLRFLSTLPMGSRNITRDIMSLNHLEEHAEKLKRNGGCALTTPATPATPAAGPQGYDYTEVNNLVRARAGEIIANVAEQLKESGLTGADLPSGIVVVGAGAKLKGLNQRLEDTLKMRVRVGTPPSRIHFADSRMPQADLVDVVAVLAAVAPKAQNCMEPVTQTELDLEPETHTAGAHTPVVTTIGDQEKPKQPHKPKPEPEPVFDDDDDDDTLVDDPDPEAHKQKREKKVNNFLKNAQRWFNKQFSENEEDLIDD